MGGIKKWLIFSLSKPICVRFWAVLQVPWGPGASFVVFWGRAARTCLAQTLSITAWPWQLAHRPIGTSGGPL